MDNVNTYPKELIQAIDNSIDLLNRHKPGWIDTIDISTLNMRHRLYCILGQVYGSYTAGTDILQLTANHAGVMKQENGEDIPLAFTIDLRKVNHDKEFIQLNAAWKYVLKLRYGNICLKKKQK